MRQKLTRVQLKTNLLMNTFPSIKQVILIFGYLIVLTISLGAFLGLINKYTLKLNDSIVELIANTVALQFISIIYLRKRKVANQDDYLIKHDKVSLGLLLLLIPFSLLLITIMDPIDSLIPVPKWFNDMMMKAVTNDIYSFVSIVIIAPVFEELISRGIILDGFLKKYDYKKAILFSSLAFGFMHLNPWQFLSAFLAGIYLGWIYYRTQSIVPCIIIHSLNNLIAFFLIVYFPNHTLISVLGGDKLHYFFVILLSIVSFIGGIVLLNKKILRKNYNGIE